MTATMTTPISHWLFDLDGTLTLAQHDFAGIKRHLGLPADLTILDGIALAPPTEQPPLLLAIERWEAELAGESQPAPDALRLLEELAAVGVTIGVLTRNTRDNALVSLAATGLDRFVPPALVIGRKEYAPKPAPDGVHALIDLGRATSPRDALMVGDHIDDVLAGKAAGTRTAWLRRGVAIDTATQHPADVVIAGLDHLLDTFEPKRADSR